MKMMMMMATKSASSCLALAGILFATLLVFHECSQVRAEEGCIEAVSDMKGRVLRGFLSPRKCSRGTLCKSGKCWCCASAIKACWNDLQSCIRHCVRSSSHTHTPPNFI